MTTDYEDTRDEVLYPEWMERDADLPERSGWLETGWVQS